MSYMTREPALRRPVIASLTSADAEFNHWLAENSYNRLVDMAGSTWRLDLRLEQTPHPDDVTQSLFRVHIGLSTDLDAAILIHSRILDPVADARLLSLLGEDAVEVRAKPQTIEARSLETMRSNLANFIDKTRDKFKKSDLRTMKRALVGDWIDKKSLFGHALTSGSQGKIDLEV